MGGQLVARLPDGAVKISSFSEASRHCHDLIHITENLAWLLYETAFLVGGLLRIRWLFNQCVSRNERAFSYSSVFFKDHR